MRTLTRWTPAAPLRRPAGVFEHPLFRISDTLHTGHWQPALDLTETADAYLVTVELPGLSSDAIHVDYERGTLIIRGEKAAEQDETAGQWRRVERSYGAFSRAVRIGAPVQADGISATYRDGVLEVRVPKAEEAKRLQISVNS